MLTLNWQVERVAEVETQVEPGFELIWLTVFLQGSELSAEEGK